MRHVLVYDPDSSVEAHTQIFVQLRFKIVTGVIPTGENLPTNKEICEGLGLSPMTVQRAYTELTKEGLAEGNKALGTKALKPPRKAVMDVAMDILYDSMQKAIGLNLTDAEIQEVLNTLARKWHRIRSGDGRRRGARAMEVDAERRSSGRRKSDR